MEELDIVKLIETNPIARLTNTYNVKLLDKMKSNFTEFEQQLFISSFYCYLNYNKTADFVIDLDNIWKWLGFSHKHKAKILLEKCFVVDIDYKCLLNLQVEQKKGRGGHNKSIIMMTIKCFKSLCLKAQTTRTHPDSNSIADHTEFQTFGSPIFAKYRHPSTIRQSILTFGMVFAREQKNRSRDNGSDSHITRQTGALCALDKWPMN